jgi:hypothetical protein
MKTAAGHPAWRTRVRAVAGSGALCVTYAFLKTDKYATCGKYYSNNEKAEILTRSPTELALHDMALFVEVARALSFTRASKVSGIPIATLSRRVATLEKRVGVRLFERTTRRLVLTQPGKRYLDRCERNRAGRRDRP